jgi:hypothetical protein
MATQIVNVYVGEQQENEIGSMTASFSSSSFVGHARLTVPYRDYKWSLWNQQNAEVTIKAGFTDINSVIRNVFHGTIKNPIKEEKTITIELDDYGQNFQRPFCGTYKDKPLGTVVKEICAECDYTAILDGVTPKTLEKLISRSDTIEYGQIQAANNTATIGESVDTICGLFKCSSNDKECQQYIDQFYTTCVKNYCKYCGKYESLVVDETSVTNTYRCTNCGALYCGIDGKQINYDQLAKIEILYGPNSDTNFAKMPSYSATNSFTYEDELRTICKNNNLYIYLTQYNTLVVKEFHGTPVPDVLIPSTAIEFKSYSFLDSANKEIKSVVVNYSTGTLQVNEDDNNPTVDKIILNHPELDQTSALSLGQQTLQAELQNLISETYITTALNPMYSTGSWIAIGTPSNGNIILYLDSINITVEANRIYRSVLTARFTPEIAQRLTNIPSSIMPTFDQLAREASAFKYSPGCNTYGCADSKRMCDSQGMSEWLYISFTGIGNQARIISFDSPYLHTSNFFSLQLMEDGRWTDFDYASYAFDSRFIPSNIRSNLQVIR